MTGRGPTTAAAEGLASVLRRNIAEMRERRESAERTAPASERLAEGITDFAGSLRFVLLHLLLFGGWILVNTLGPAGWRFDPSLVVLAMAASVEAIFLSTFILISQNRISAAERRRAELDLQINLLAEHEVTRLIDLVTRIAERLEVPARDADLDELRRDVAPGAVLDTLAEPQDPPVAGHEHD
ncbi:DUF1003 domain-containing protein [Brevundimonas sp.]|uniref:DUF1003 domain-containing protein n=1 Tax=Brevundimonas sp. TaxID=1871086 RepID=UPI002D253446|nr:DUF1003 domain-containing protein [Brevundimonas sp.]HYC67096.1 DUF1003 domain-containing protein [Brevundimonas sp.]